MSSGRRQSARGVTLVEVLIVVAIIGVTTGIAVMGSGVAESARLRRSAVMIASAIRVAYGHANATSRPVRLVFNLDNRTVGLEESEGQLWLSKNDRTGGAAAATEAERKAVAEAEAIVKGPRAPRPAFRPVKVFGFSAEKGKQGKELERNIRFVQIETSHQDDVVKSDQAYLYFWPGGQTERAAIQLSVGGSTADADVLTILVSPLTGKAEMKKGRFNMPRPRDDNEESERRDGF
ncbi:MAG: prepilin-type N-terminal cleavage/methylation domain-containing protein [Minicystis sp.]